MMDPAPPPPPPPLTQEDVDKFRVSVEKLEQLAPAPTAAAATVVVPTGVTNTEPVRAANAVQSIPLAILTVLVAFHIWSPTDVEWVAVLGLYTALSIKVSELARGKVWSPASVAAALAEAKKD